MDSSRAQAPRLDPNQALQARASARAQLILKPGRDKSLRRRHPWVFSGALERLDGQPSSGAMIAIRASDGSFLGWARTVPPRKSLPGFGAGTKTHR